MVNGVVYLTSPGVQLILKFNGQGLLSLPQVRGDIFISFVSSLYSFPLSPLSLSFIFSTVSGGGRVVRRCCVSYITGASN